MSNAAQSRDENADVNPRDDEEDTPLSFQAAAERGNEAAVKLLLEQGGVDVDSRDYLKRSPPLPPPILYESIPFKVRYIMHSMLPKT